MATLTASGIRQQSSVHGNERIAAIDTLMIMAYNIVCGDQAGHALERRAIGLGREVVPGNGAGRTRFSGV
jgi:hypothetical protein